MLRTGRCVRRLGAELKLGSRLAVTFDSGANGEEGIGDVTDTGKDFAVPVVSDVESNSGSADRDIGAAGCIGSVLLPAICDSTTLGRRATGMVWLLS